MLCVDARQVILTCVGKSPAVFVEAQKASEVVTELVQVHRRRPYSHHLNQKKGKGGRISRRSRLFNDPPLQAAADTILTMSVP